MRYVTTDIQFFERIFTIIAIVLCACAFAATDLVFLGYSPILSNQQSQHTSFVVNVALLSVLGGLICVLVATFIHPKAASLRRPLLLVFTAMFTMEALLFAFDKVFLSVKGSVLDSSSYTIRMGNESLYLGQPNPLSPFGFRSPRLEPKIAPGKRILFLGNSYVEGSGSTFAVNYPQAVEANLNRLLPNQGLTVFSAGVNGYGVGEDRMIYQYLTEQGYRFDTVILNYTLGSDPTNDIPGTIRSAIAGQAQRLPENLFLRYFYPMNTYTLRFIAYLDVTFNQKLGAGGLKAKEGGPCREDPNFVAFTTERAHFYYGPGAKNRIDMAFTASQIDALARNVGQNGAHFGVVLLPDPNGMLARNRDRFVGLPLNLDWIHQYLSEEISGKYSLLDLSDSFRDQPALFRCNDTHWSDKGNLRAAELVAEFLAKNMDEHRLQNADTAEIRISSRSHDNNSPK